MCEIQMLVPFLLPGCLAKFIHFWFEADFSLLTNRDLFQYSSSNRIEYHHVSYEKCAVVQTETRKLISTFHSVNIALCISLWTHYVELYYILIYVRNDSA